MNNEKLFLELMENATVEDLQNMVYQCNSEDGSLEELCYYDFDDDFFNTYFYDNPMEAARATHFGDVNWMDNYIHFNAYGNLETISDYGYTKLLEDNKDEIIGTYVDLFSDEIE